ncbi:MAG TPA: hypothetical protein VG409_09275, partial [Actinomycetota bacterium]|nr:hypothetical protein [Actinomycetota bacterium]
MDEGLAGWCRRWLGAEPVAVLFRAGYLSEVTGLRLADGRALGGLGPRPSRAVAPPGRPRRRPRRPPRPGLAGPGRGRRPGPPGRPPPAAPGGRP